MISQEIKKKVHLALPVVFFDRYLPLALREGFSLEVGLDDEALDKFTEKDFQAFARTLDEHDIKRSVHAPFRDLSPGALDAAIRRTSVNRLKQALETAAIFSPEIVVLHTGFHAPYHLERKDSWLGYAREGFAEITTHAEKLGLKLALENVSEPDPSWLTPIVEEIKSPALGYCFDAGHAYAFAKTTWEPWLYAFGPRLFELHVHDNDGSWDLHLPPGQGKIPFAEIFSYLARKGIKPLVTFEAHRKEDVLQGLIYLEELFSQTSW